MQPVRIDVSDKMVGRAASAIALALQGKHQSRFRPYKTAGQEIVVTNTDKLRFSGKKFAEKRYFRHTGVIGHLRETRAEDLFRRDSREVLKRAIRGMLPKNRLLKERMRNLMLYKGDEER